MVYVKDTTQEDIDTLVKDMRRMDRLEGWALTYASPKYLAQKSFDNSQIAKTVWSEDDELLCVFGFLDGAPVGRGGIPWLLGTDKLNENKKELVKRSRAIIQDMLETTYNTMHNRVWADNKASIKFLRALGFTIGPKEIQPNGTEYHEFSMVRSAPHV